MVVDVEKVDPKDFGGGLVDLELDFDPLVEGHGEDEDEDGEGVEDGDQVEVVADDSLAVHCSHFDEALLLLFHAVAGTDGDVDVGGVVALHKGRFILLSLVNYNPFFWLVWGLVIEIL